MTEGMVRWQQFRTRRDRKRRRIGRWAAAGFYGLLALVLVLGSLFSWTDLRSPGSPLAVKLGAPDGEDLPLAVTPQSDPALQALVSGTYQPPVETPRPDESSEGTPLPAATRKEPKTAKVPTPAASPAPAPAEKAERKVKGKENGNVSETTFTDGSALVGRSLYVPIYLYMPLPRKIPNQVMGKVSEEIKNSLTAHYAPGPDWVLQSQPVLDDRPGFWAALEKAGFDLARADYKEGLRGPVVLTFLLSPPQNGQGPRLLDLLLSTSCGSPAVDEAVLYGFRQSSYANGSGHEVEGRFSYDFQKLN